MKVALPRRHPGSSDSWPRPSGSVRPKGGRACVCARRAVRIRPQCVVSGACASKRFAAPIGGHCSKDPEGRSMNHGRYPDPGLRHAVTGRMALPVRRASPDALHWALAALMAAAGWMAPAGAEPVKAMDREFEAAVRHFQAGRVSLAFGRFTDLANRGDTDAARIALFLHAYGPMLHGKHWDAEEEDLANWQRLAGRGGLAPTRPRPEFVPLAVPVAPVTARPGPSGGRAPAVRGREPSR